MSLQKLRLPPRCPVKRLWTDRLDYEYDFFVEPNIISQARRSLLADPSRFKVGWLKDRCPPEITDIKVGMSSYFSDSELLSAFALVREKMKPLFDATGFEDGWSDHRVFGRLRDRHMMFVMLYAGTQLETYGEVSNTGRTLSSRAVAGFIAFKVEMNEDLDQPRAWVMEVHVNDKFQRRGIATALIGYTASLCLSVGIYRLELCVMLENLAAINLYMKRMKFTVLEELEDGKILQLPLDPWPFSFEPVEDLALL